MVGVVGLGFGVGVGFGFAGATVQHVKYRQTKVVVIPLHHLYLGTPLMVKKPLKKCKGWYDFLYELAIIIYRSAVDRGAVDNIKVKRRSKKIINFYKNS